MVPGRPVVRFVRQLVHIWGMSWTHQRLRFCEEGVLVTVGLIEDERDWGGEEMGRGKVGCGENGGEEGRKREKKG